MKPKSRYTLSIDPEIMDKFDNKIVTGEIKSGSRSEEIEKLIQEKLEEVEG